MKRTLSLVLALVMVLGSFSAVFAAEVNVEKEAGALLKKLGVLVGDASGDLMLEDGLKRQDAVILLSKLMGEFDEAAATKGSPTFKDIKDNFYLPFLAWAQANGTFVGHSEARFGFDDNLTTQEYASVLLRVLGYEVKWEETLAKAEELKLLANVEADAKFVRGTMAVMTLNALGTKMNDSEETLADKLEIEMPAPAKLAVNDIKANTANSFKITFNKAVTDEDKLTFEVTRGSSKVSVTPTFSEDKLSVTLASATTLAIGNYNVQVLADSQEIAKKEIIIEAQKLAKIVINSTTLSVAQDGKGYATYSAYDQYDQDVTSSYIAQSINFMTGAGSIEKKHGMLILTPGAGVNLIALPTVAISAYDTNSAVTVTASLTPAIAVGTLKSFELLPAEPLAITAGDTTTVIYVPFKAFDMSGNETKNYDIIKQGLILDETNNDAITVTNNWVTANLVQDPVNPNNAAVKVVATATTPGNFNMDLPFNITAMTKNGNVSTIAGILKPVAAIETITLLAPTEVVAQGERADIPFDAYDKTGKKLTKTSEINPDTTLNLNGLSYGTKVDGTMYLYTTDTFANEGPKMFSASVTNTGKFSNITVVAQKAAKADSMTLALATRAQEVGRVLKAGFGYDDGTYAGITVKDQYGRTMNMVRGSYLYTVKVTQETGNDTLVIGDKDADLSAVVDGDDAVIIGKGATGIQIKAVNKGSETLRFTLYDTDGTTVIATRAHTFTVVNTADIVSYTVTPRYAEIYADDAAYNTTFTVRGKTISGTAVDLVAANTIVSVKPVNVTDFESSADAKTINAKVSTTGYNAKSSETVVNVTVLHGGNIAMLTTNVKSSIVKPYAKDIDFGITDDEAIAANISFVDDILTVKATDFNGFGNISELSAEGFSVEDNYGRTLMSPSNYYITSKNAAAGTVTVAADGTLTNAGTSVAGGSFILTAVTSNGLVKTIKIVLN